MDQKKPIGLIGCPVQVGAGRPGCVLGPNALRCARIKREFETLNYQVTDFGDVQQEDPKNVNVTGNAKKPEEIAAWTRSIHDRGVSVFKEGHFPVFMGGDHSMAAGSIAAAAKYAADQGKTLAVIWIDAHPDYNTPKTSLSGNMHGMPVAALCGEPDLQFLYEGLDHQPLSPDHFYMLGIRSVDQGEHDLITSRGINIYDMQRIDRMNICSVMDQILFEIQSKDALIHVSFDVDGLDPDLAPAVGTRVPGGLTFREAHTIMEMIGESGLAVSMDITELNPMLDHEGKTAYLMIDFATSLLGKRVIYGKDSGYLK